MGSSRTLNSVRNIIWAVINKVAIIIMPFIVRTVMIHKLGAEYTGLSSLFTSILTMLSLAELGFSNAMVYCMYEPIHNNDKDTICALLNLYKKIYSIIGCIVLSVGLVLVPFLPKLIKGDVPEGINIYVLYLIFLANSVVSYFLFAYKSSLLTAFQRSDVISAISLTCHLGMYGLQIVSLLVVKSFYVYSVFLPLSTIVMNLFYHFMSKKLFPEFSCYGDISNELKAKIKKRVVGMMLYKISSTTRTSFDSIIISSFLGLIILTSYQNYFMIISSVLGVLAVVGNAITSSVGDSIVSRTKEANYTDFRKFVFIYMWISGVLAACIYGLLQPFMKMWVGEGLMFDSKMAILFVIYFYSQTMGDMVFVYRTAAGLWWEDRIRPIVEAIANIVLNILLVRLLGIYGVILATIITLLGINFLWGAEILFKHYFKRDMKEYLLIQLKQLVLSGLICLSLTFVFSRFNENLMFFIIRLICCLLLSNLIFILFNMKSQLYKDAKSFGLNIFRVLRNRKKNI